MSFVGTVSRSSLVVPTSALTKMALPPRALEHDGVLGCAHARKERPRISSFCPIATCMRRDRESRPAPGFFFGRSVGVDGGTRSRGDHDGAEGGHEGGTAQEGRMRAREKSSWPLSAEALNVLRGQLDGARRLRGGAQHIAAVSVTTTRSSIRTPPRPGTYTPGSTVTTLPRHQWSCRPIAPGAAPRGPRARRRGRARARSGPRAPRRRSDRARRRPALALSVRPAPPSRAALRAQHEVVDRGQVVVELARRPRAGAVRAVARRPRPRWSSVTQHAAADLDVGAARRAGARRAPPTRRSTEARPARAAACASPPRGPARPPARCAPTRPVSNSHA